MVRASNSKLKAIKWARILVLNKSFGLLRSKKSNKWKK
jgi:hypothetical protein